MKRYALIALIVGMAPGPCHAQSGEDERVPQEDPPVPHVPQGVVPFDLAEVMRGEGQPMTAELTAELSVARAPSIARARAAAAAAHAGADRAIYAFIPQLTMSGRYTRLTPLPNGQLDSDQLNTLVRQVDDPEAQQLWTRIAERPLPGGADPVGLDQVNANMTLRYPVSDAFLEMLPRYESNQGIAEAQELQVEAATAAVGLAAREAFYQYARARATLAVAQLAHRQAVQRQELIEARGALGQAHLADVQRLRAQTAAARVAVVRAEGGAEIAATAIRTLTHTEGFAPIGIGEDVFSAELEPIGARAEILERALRQRPEARALRRLVGARGRAVDAAEGQRYPSLFVAGQAVAGYPSGRLFPRTDEFRLYGTVSVILEWSLHDTLEGERLADEARSSQNQTRADLETIQDAIRNQVAEAFVSYNTAREALGAAHIGRTAAQESYRLRLADYSVGEAIVSTLVDASIDQIRAELDAVNAAIDARIALARLRYATGRQ